MKNINNSIIRFSVTDKQYNTNTPYRVDLISGVTGTGFVINNLIVTCAHIAYDKHSLRGRLASSDEHYAFEIVYSVPQLDIAFLTTNNKKFWDQVESLVLGDMPKQLDKIRVVGFPLGSENLRSTEGIVSSFQYDSLVYSSAKALLMQIDANSNGGNSGGPVLSADDSVVGMICQSLTGTDITPQSFALAGNQVINAFNKYFFDKSSIIPALPIKFQLLQDKTTREHLGLSDSMRGVRITSIAKCSSLYPNLQVGDVILKVDGHQLSNAGKITTEFSAQIDFEYLIGGVKDLGDEVVLTIIRNGEQMEVVHVLDDSVNSVKIPHLLLNSQEPTYIIYNGLLFSSFSVKPGYSISSEYLLKHFNTYRSEERFEVVYFQQKLPLGLNNELDNSAGRVIVEVNGKPIINMWDMLDALNMAVERHSIITEDGKLIVTPKMTKDIEDELKERYQLTSLCSRDLKPENHELYFSCFPQKLRDKLKPTPAPTLTLMSADSESASCLKPPCCINQPMLNNEFASPMQAN